MSERTLGSFSRTSKQSDEELVLRASNGLRCNISVPPISIKVQVRKGVVTLSGEIDWAYQKFAAAESVRYLTGVVGVDNQIVIKPKLNSRW
jgi:osmotically-inducible protein OsmY